ncbi:MAG: SDR family NAD(P)-dependent oxidoreductase [Thermomicrobiales bacterium]
MPLSNTTTYIPSRDITWDFEGQVVLVTGAAHGQGASHAKAFAEAGANLVVSDIAGEMKYVEYPLGSISELEDVAQEVRDMGGECLSSVCDVRQPDQVKSLGDRTMEKFGRIDVLINNAGIGTIAKVVDMPKEKWDETVETDLSGCFYFCKYVAPHMIAARSGRIITTGSTQSIGGANWLAHYTAAKHGLRGLVQGFATELAPHGVTINLICPTAVDTSINQPFTDPRFDAWNQEAARLVGAWNLFQNEMMHEREVTEGMLWLASKEAAGFNGMTLMVDAGCLCK